uniref:THAP domain-containing protein 7 isoform X2 n=1 Tax=Scatophagus argus TaxID=75038 RepID=UPI001ED83910|nr:THAP domain-containing protein 7 isoform X2 [Scatophagus argus]
MVKLKRHAVAHLLCQRGTMPRHCSAGGCKSRDNRETRNAGITFHKLPKGETRRNLWITNSHRTDSWDPQTDFVYFCSKHFTPESFELTGCSGIRRLKDDAFPTVFDSFSTTKGKRPGPLQKQEDIPVRKSSCSGHQQNTQLTEKGEPSEEPADQRPVAVALETNENIPVSSQESSGEEQLSQQEPVSRPLSPSRFMRRLPPPPGFYLSKEHSYAQLCPLLWRRRYYQAIDCLEKALRQLHAARRRENRLRSTVLRFRDKRLKQALLVSQDDCKNRGSWTPGVEKRRGKGGYNHEESEIGAKSEDTQVFEDTCVDQVELGGHFLPHTNSWSEEGRGYCFYCGREQVEVGGQVARKDTKTGKDTLPTMHKESLKIQRSVETGMCSTAENDKNIQVVRLERPPVKNVESNDSYITNSMSLTDIQKQFQQRQLLSDVCEGENEAVGQEHHLDLQQQLFWIEDSAEGQVILVPVSAEDGLQSILKMEGVTDEAQTILVSEVDLKGDLAQNSGGLSRVETACNGDQNSVVNITSVEMREDVREKLKEHLEGFHLQLSTEFLL